MISLAQLLKICEDVEHDFREMGWRDPPHFRLWFPGDGGPGSTIELLAKPPGFAMTCLRVPVTRRTRTQFRVTILCRDLRDYAEQWDALSRPTPLKFACTTRNRALRLARRLRERFGRRNRFDPFNDGDIPF